MVVAGAIVVRVVRVGRVGGGPARPGKPEMGGGSGPGPLVGTAPRQSREKSRQPREKPKLPAVTLGRSPQPGSSLAAAA